jgi:5'-methylthioadenosine phosphorylase
VSVKTHCVNQLVTGYLNREKTIMTETPVLAVLGGTGLYHYEKLTDLETIELDTPFGKPSSPIIIGSLAGKRVAFIARHGIGHTFNPSEVNYRANIYAIKSLGIRRVVAVSACGSLRDDYAPGHLVLPDQLVDFTRGRARSFFSEGLVAHISVADPFCDDLSQRMFEAVKPTGATIHQGGTFITIEGPRFSTKAESNLYRAWGMDIIGMTTSPEAYLAREAELCYISLAHITDYDVWHVSEEAVSVEMIIRTLHENAALVQDAIQNLTATLDDAFRCECEDALSKALTTQADKIPAETRQRLDLLVDKYLTK